MLFNLALHMNHQVILSALMVATIFFVIYAAKEKNDERKRA
jgi:uncharacterized membrane protein YozB (DUF420 family)